MRFYVSFDAMLKMFSVVSGYHAKSIFFFLKNCQLKFLENGVRDSETLEILVTYLKKYRRKIFHEKYVGVFG